MKECHRHQTAILLFIITLSGMAILVVKILNMSGSDNNRHISSRVDPESHIGQGITGQRIIHEPVRSPIIEQIIATPDTLWLVDKRLVAISLDVVAAPMTRWKIVRVIKNEPEYRFDDTDAGPDAIFVGQMLKLRAERNRAGGARTYTVYLRVYNRNPDGSQESILATVEVKVPSSESNDVNFAT